MSYPITIVSGPAGSGKDTVAELAAKHFGGITIAQANPMKRIVKAWLGRALVTDEMLWGSSDLRNTPLKLSEIQQGILEGSINTVIDMLSEVLVSVGRPTSFFALQSVVRPWCDKLLNGDYGPLSPRLILQTLGTEVGRSLDQNMWIDYAIWTAERLLVGGYSYEKTTGLKVDENNKGYKQVIITDGRFRNEILAVRKLGGLAVRIVPKESTTTEVGIKGHASEAEMKTIPDTWFTHTMPNDKSKGLKNLEEVIMDAWPDDHPRYIW